jgi:cell division protein FtsX
MHHRCIKQTWDSHERGERSTQRESEALSIPIRSAAVITLTDNSNHKAMETKYKERQPSHRNHDDQAEVDADNCNETEAIAKCASPDAFPESQMHI